MLNRLEKFRQRRTLRQKYLTSAFLFFFILTAGLLSADYSTNALMSEHKGIVMFEMNQKTSSLEIIFMNQRLYINTQYISRDLERFKKEIGNLWIRVIRL